MSNSSWVLHSALVMVAVGCGEIDKSELVDENGKTPVEAEELGQTQQAIEYNGHDYLFVISARNWDDAQAYCRQQGYDLVTVNDASEESWLHSQQTSRSNNHWWIGYTDRGFEGSWRWISGLYSNYSNWSIGNPNNYEGQHCATDNWISTGRWDDDYCWFSFPFICESASMPNKGYFSYSTTNTASATQNTHDYAIQLYQGMVLTFGTCGVPGAGGSGDTYLRLLNPQGNELAANDDACGGYLSNLSYVIPSTGTYYIRAGCFSSGSCSGTVALNY